MHEPTNFLGVGEEFIVTKLLPSDRVKFFKGVPTYVVEAVVDEASESDLCYAFSADGTCLLTHDGSSLRLGL